MCRSSLLGDLFDCKIMTLSKQLVKFKTLVWIALYSRKKVITPASVDCYRTDQRASRTIGWGTKTVGLESDEEPQIQVRHLAVMITFTFGNILWSTA